MSVADDLRRSIYLDSFYDFYVDAFKNVLDSSATYLDNWHTKYLCDQMQAEFFRIKNSEPYIEGLIINVPIRSGKSLIMSVAFNAWAWAVWPEFKLITGSYSNKLAINLSRKTRELIRSDWYRHYFNVDLKPDQFAKGYYENTAGGFRMATSTGGSITGEGAHMIIADDLSNPEEAESDVMREACNTWYDETLFSRVNNPSICSRIIVMQRLHEKDLSGHLLENGGYRHICIPAILTGDVKPAYLAEYYNDNLFFKERFTRQVLDSYKVALHDRGFSAQLQQSPFVKEGNIFKTDKIIRTKEEPTCLRVYQSIDTAFKTGQQNDYSVIITGHLYREDGVDKMFIKNVKRDKLEYPDLLRKVKAYASHYKAHKILIEDKASGQSIVQDLKRVPELKGRIEPVQVDKDKVSRAYAVTNYIDLGRVSMLAGQDWEADFIKELKMFDSGEHDDQVDAFTQLLLNSIGKKGPSIRIL